MTSQLNEKPSLLGLITGLVSGSKGTEFDANPKRRMFVCLHTAAHRHLQKYDRSGATARRTRGCGHGVGNSSVTLVS